MPQRYDERNIEQSDGIYNLLQASRIRVQPHIPFVRLFRQHKETCPWFLCSLPLGISVNLWINGENSNDWP